MSKKIHVNDITGQAGVYLVGQRLSEMGFQFYPTGGVEAGIDGTIEIRNPETGDVTNQIVQVQIKSTTKAWPQETNLEFTFRCDERDLHYWLNGNTPVILVVCRPTTGEAYWVPIKQYFEQHPEHRLDRKVHFDRRKDRFNKAAAARLVELSTPKHRGVYFAPIRRTERLISNLLEVRDFARTIHSADTEYSKAAHLWAEARERDVRLPSEWILWKGRIWSFRDLRDGPWSRFTDLSTYEQDLDSHEWAYSGDPDERRRFVHLLQRSLSDMLWRLRMRFEKKLALYYFRPGKELHTGGLKELEVEYRTHKGRSSSITVFSAYPDSLKPSYYRHHAYRLQFREFGDGWYLEITPTYHFTDDGWRTYPFYEDKLKGIKRLEGNRAILSPVELLAWKLSGENPLFGSDSLLTFGRLCEFEVDYGINDELWESDKDDTVVSLSPLPLFS